MILKIFLFWRFGLFFITYLGAKLFPLAQNGGIGAAASFKSFDYWLSWAQWDGGYYYNIAQRGYLQFTDFAFFPLYPLLVNILDRILPTNTLFTGLLISNLAFLGFLLTFYKLIGTLYPKKVAASATLTLLFFPTAFFAAAFYTEGLFLLLVALTFLLMYSKRPLLAAVAVALATTTRLVGVALIVSIFYNYFAQIGFRFKKITTKILLLSVSLFGLAAYSIYLFSTRNTIFPYISIQNSWQRVATDPVSSIFTAIWGIFTNPILPPDKYFEVITILSFLVILIKGAKKIPSSLWIFSVLALLIPASSGTLTSMPRYALSSIGVFAIIGVYLEDHPRLKMPLWTIFLTIQAILAVRFINGFWVA